MTIYCHAEIHEKWLGESHTSPKGINDYLSWATAEIFSPFSFNDALMCYGFVMGSAPTAISLCCFHRFITYDSKSSFCSPIAHIAWYVIC